VWSYVVGPEEVVVRRTATQLPWPGGAAEVGVCSISQVEELVDRVLDGG
jgi:hypothetical protein